MTEPLKPCPFCGFDWARPDSPEGTRWSVICMRCFSQTASYGREDIAIKAWNRRAEA